MKSNGNSFRNKLKISLTVMSSFALIVLFQNCGRDGFQTKMLDQLDLASENQNDQSELPNNDLPEITDDNEMQEITNIFNNPQNENNSEVSIDNSASSIIAASSTGKVYYVSTSGNNSNPGTMSKPFKTIAYAVSKMVAGETTFVRGGVYKESKIHFKVSGTSSAKIQLLNAPGEFPIIDFTSAVLNTVADKRIFIENKDGERKPIGWITIEGFEIRNGAVGIHIKSGNNIIIRRNWIHHAKSQGILGNGKDILIDRNVVNHNGNFQSCANGAVGTKGVDAGTSVCNKDHGIYGMGPRWSITNNQIYDNLASGIHMAGYEHCPNGVCPSGSTKYIKIFVDASYGGASGWLIANNTIAYQNYREAIIVWQRLATNSKIVNNIFYENSQKYPSAMNGISFWGSGGGHMVQNNIFYARSPGATSPIGGSTGWQSKYTATNNKMNNASPNFAGAGVALTGVPNFKLKAGSPAINMGLSLISVKTDFLGKLRQGAFDIGAYEY